MSKKIEALGERYFDLSSRMLGFAYCRPQIDAGLAHGSAN